MLKSWKNIITYTQMRDMENVFITPFTGGRSDKYAERILTVIEPNIRAYLDGTTKYMKNIVQF